MPQEIEISDTTQPTALADFIELTLLFSGDESLSRAELQANLAPRDVPDVDVDFAFKEIDGRAARAPGGYPFRRDGEIVARVEGTGAQGQVYDFMVVASAAGTVFRVTRDYKAADMIFDAVVAETMAVQLGTGSRAIVFANPALEPVATSSNFAIRIAKLAELMEAGPVGPTVPEDRNDGGVDVVAWKRFADDGPGYPVYLVQNTVSEAYGKKRSDIVLAEWEKWLPGLGRLNQAFAVPRVVDRKSGDDLAVVNHLVLDRLRIMELLEAGQDLSCTLTPAIRDFLAEQLAAEALDGDDGVVRPQRVRKPKSTSQLAEPTTPLA